MSDETVDQSAVDTTETEVQSTIAPESDTETEDKDWKSETEKWRSLARKHEAKAKANAEAAEKLAQFEESQKSEQQKLADQLSATQKELAELRVSEIRREAATAAGLDQKFIKFITADDAEAALEQAQELAEQLKPDPKPADFKQGVRQTAKPAPSMDDWLRGVAGR